MSILLLPYSTENFQIKVLYCQATEEGLSFFFCSHLTRDHWFTGRGTLLMSEGFHTPFGWAGAASRWPSAEGTVAHADWQVRMGVTPPETPPKSSRCFLWPTRMVHLQDTDSREHLPLTPGNGAAVGGLIRCLVSPHGGCHTRPPCIRRARLSSLPQSQCSVPARVTWRLGQAPPFKLHLYWTTRCPVTYQHTTRHEIPAPTCRPLRVSLTLGLLLVHILNTNPAIL